MYYQILKKDLKRKKTMNIILFLFIVLATTFIASSVNNLVTIMGGMEEYTKLAELPDYIVDVPIEKGQKSTPMDNFLKKCQYVKGYEAYEMPYLVDDNISVEKKEETYQSKIGINSLSSAMVKIFDMDNNPITKIKEGEIYLPLELKKLYHLEEGDTFTITKKAYKKEFKVAGFEKDIIFGSSMMGITRIFLSESDYENIIDSKDFTSYQLYGVTTNDIVGYEEAFNQEGIPILFSADQSTITMMYVMDMVIAGVLLIFSMIIIIISFVILRFTISFTMSEEYREIGVMKALGIKGRKIRYIYIIKYLVVSIISGGLGLGLSIPFGNVLLNQVSESIVLKSDGSLVWNILCAIVVVIITVLYCYGCTRKINKVRPLEALRNGGTGERFQRKGFLRLKYWHTSTILYMVCNDILSNFRRYITLLVIFTLGVIVIIVPVNTMNTLKSNQLSAWFNMAPSDVIISSQSMFGETDKTREELENELNEVKKNLAKQGMNASVFQEMMFSYSINFHGKRCNSIAAQGIGEVTTERYSYIEGTPPRNNNEVAITHIIADKIGATIGDTVDINENGIDKKYRFDYITSNSMNVNIRVITNIIYAMLFSIIIGIMIWIHKYILMPFSRLTNIPYELSKGNLTVPMKESKSKLFGRFVWGIDLLRENMEEQKKRELALQKEKKTLILSISHDIKTPLSAIKLYANAISKNLYKDVEKQKRIGESINQKADDIEKFLSQIIKASSEEFIDLQIKKDEFYLQQLLDEIYRYYKERLKLLSIPFTIVKGQNCLMKGDLDRSIEVLQNIMENSIKYGDGNGITIEVHEEEENRLITVINTGCTLNENEIPHIFDSFWRGSNVKRKDGSGLGLYICRELMHGMDGDIFVKLHEDEIKVTAVFRCT